ncbi:class I SAM-dependent methyltransferase [Spirulina subsalsa FACHB-351]|uniref:Class I SAM-dependent methyltransferase n=1 Tax=Spirulina subsalsa FACHB-351 TaxID=234711 RepID=A0ABT3L6C0_9CYAN|nr:class I SAM-dependent methyltransferase [Spirulina subsalsa]MCW6037048.1 class I SAM-dependent methyltransferase [Spirulina subsalsa FACHB-351]
MPGEYLTKQRMISQYNQKRMIRLLGESVKNVLEIGIYNSLFYHLLSSEGYQVTRADFNPDLKPDFVLDLRSDFELPRDTFDAIALFQVLEHIPYEDFEKAIQRLANFTKKYIVISLPYNSSYCSVQFQLSFNRRPRSLLLQVPKFWSTKTYTPDEHYWEIGLKGYPKKRIVRSLENAGLKIRQEYQDPLYPYHYFFILEKL